MSKELLKANLKSNDTVLGRCTPFYPTIQIPAQLCKKVFLFTKQILNYHLRIQIVFT